MEEAQLVFGKAEAQELKTEASIILCVSHLSQGAVTEGLAVGSGSQLPERRGQGVSSTPGSGVGPAPEDISPSSAFSTA